MYYLYLHVAPVYQARKTYVLMGLIGIRNWWSINHSDPIDEGLYISSLRSEVLVFSLVGKKRNSGKGSDVLSLFLLDLGFGSLH